MGKERSLMLGWIKIPEETRADLPLENDMFGLYFIPTDLLALRGYPLESRELQERFQDTNKLLLLANSAYPRILGNERKIHQSFIDGPNLIAPITTRLLSPFTVNCVEEVEEGILFYRHSLATKEQYRKAVELLSLSVSNSRIWDPIPNPSNPSSWLNLEPVIKPVYNSFAEFIDGEFPELDTL